MRSLIRPIATVLFTLIMVGIALAAWRTLHFPSFRELLGLRTPIYVEDGQPVLEVELVQKLVTSRVHVNDILTAAGEGYKSSWVIVGDADLVIDLDQHKTEYAPKTKTVTVRLPVPKVCRPRVNMEKSRKWDTKRASWVEWIVGDKDLVEQAALRHAQKMVEKYAGAKEFVVRSKSHAELIIQGLFSTAGWDARIEWIEPAPSSADLGKSPQQPASSSE